MSKDDHLRAIYTALREVSPFVRRSMFMTQAVSCVEEQSGRTVLWISEAHHLFATLRYNLERGALGKAAIMHQAELVGIPMWGVYEEHMMAVVDLVWKEFLLDPVRFPVYCEDGPLINDALPPAIPRKDPLAVGAIDNNNDLEVPPMQVADADNDGWVTVDVLPITISPRVETIDRASLIGRHHHDPPVAAAAAAAHYHHELVPENKHKSE